MSDYRSPEHEERLDTEPAEDDACDAAARAATGRSYRTLERVCTVIADALEERFPATDVVVTAAKPEPPLPLPVDEVSVEVAR